MKFDHNNISPLDNRYLSKIEDIRSIFSEYSLLKTRFLIEINWLLYLCQKYPNYFSKLSNQSKMGYELEIIFAIWAGIHSNYWIL